VVLVVTAARRDRIDICPAVVPVLVAVPPRLFGNGDDDVRVLVGSRCVADGDLLGAVAIVVVLVMAMAMATL
jgi:hypothetical protein